MHVAGHVISAWLRGRPIKIFRRQVLRSFFYFIFKSFFMSFKLRFAWQAPAFRRIAKYEAGAGVREGCKNTGRRGAFEEGSKPRFLRGRGDKGLCFVRLMF